MTAAFHTLGCKVNQYETRAMMKLMAGAGYDTIEYIPGETRVDDGVIVINSCTVTGESDRKLRQLLRRCRRDNPGAVLVLTGCMPQAFPETAEGFAEADIVLGNAARAALPGHVARFLTIGARIVDIPAHGDTLETLAIDAFPGRTRAFVKIEDGCNRFCSYCIIPYARGRVRSRSLASLREELETLAARGYREVVLVGINLTAYGQDCGLTLADAVDTACSVEGIQRVRLGSLEPDFLTPAMISRLQGQDKLCEQFHLSLQSGCDATLRRMNRHYTPAAYAAVCEALRAAFPGCALTTDVMVGFPGEDEAEFAASLAFVQSVGFARVHVFAYSRRPGTVAADAPGQVLTREKAHRSHILIEACEQQSEQYMRTHIGRTMEVLLEARDDAGTHGYTRNYLPVRLAAAGEPGALVPVRLTAVHGGVCLGELAEV